MSERAAAACNHPMLRFHSGGYFIQCDACKGWWAAVKNAHTSDQEYDYSRGGSVVSGGDVRSASDPKRPENNLATKLYQGATGSKV